MEENKKLISQDARIWIYRASKPLDLATLKEAQSQMKSFLGQWQSHGSRLFADAGIFYNQFLVVMLDETYAGASGCSIDSMVRFIESLGISLEVNFFDMSSFHVSKDKDVVTYSSAAAFKNAIAVGEIDARTMVFDHTVATKYDLDTRWVMPLHQTWMNRLLSSSKAAI